MQKTLFAAKALLIYTSPGRPFKRGMDEDKVKAATERTKLTSDNNGNEWVSPREQEIKIYGRELPQGYSKKFGPRRRSIEYTPCNLQSNDEAPYYVSLAARVMGIETEEANKQHMNTMDLPFDWRPNERITEEQFNATNNLCLWSTLPSSVTSVNLTICLVKELHEQGSAKSDFVLVWLTCAALPLAFAFIIELSIISALSDDFSSIHEEAKEGFCQQETSMQFAVVSVFIISELKTLYEILSEISIGLSSKRCVYDTSALQQLFLSAAGAFWGKGKRWTDTSTHRLIVKEVETGPFSFFVYWFSVAMETYIFCLTVKTGIYYTLTQQDASSIVQAAVAISFINEIDNLLYVAISSQEMKLVMESCVYEVPLIPINSFAGEGYLHFIFRQHQLLVQVPILAILATAIVFSLRYVHCSDDEEEVWW